MLSYPFTKWIECQKPQQIDFAEWFLDCGHWPVTTTNTNTQHTYCSSIENGFLTNCFSILSNEVNRVEYRNPSPRQYYRRIFISVWKWIANGLRRSILKSINSNGSVHFENLQQPVNWYSDRMCLATFGRQNKEARQGVARERERNESMNCWYESKPLQKLLLSVNETNCSRTTFYGIMFGKHNEYTSKANCQRIESIKLIMLFSRRFTSYICFILCVSALEMIITELLY